MVPLSVLRVFGIKGNTDNHTHISVFFISTTDPISKDESLREIDIRPLERLKRARQTH